MRRALPVLLLALAACGGAPADAPETDPETESAATVESFGAVDVPRIGTVGDLPPAERTVEITVDADGALSVDRSATDLAGLTPALRERAGGGAVGEPVDADALLVLDAELPWRVGQLCMQECAAAGFDRLFFAVRHLGDGEPGAFAAFLPRDRGLARQGSKPVPKIATRLRPTGSFGMPCAALGTAVERCIERYGVAPAVEIQADGDATIVHVLAVASAAAQGGAGLLFFAGTPPVGDGGLPAEVQAHRLKHRLGLSLEIVGVTLSEAERLDAESREAVFLAGDVPPRVSGAYAGFATEAGSFGIQEEEELELVEPDER
jgi:biopolymer transport protein ExbD